MEVSAKDVRRRQLSLFDTCMTSIAKRRVLGALTETDGNLLLRFNREFLGCKLGPFVTAVTQWLVIR